MDQLNILIFHFNNYSKILSDYLVNLAPKSSIGKYKKIIDMLIRRKSPKLIENFIISALVYEDKIMMGDEDFFLGKTLENNKNIEDDQMKNIFEFKSIWGLLDRDTHYTIKSYMKLLCQIARKYFDTKYKCV